MTRQENKQLYLELLNLVNDKFPSEFADRIKLADTTIKISTITNVRYGRSPKLDVLLFMVRELIPGFIIPDKFIQAERELINTAA